MSFVEDHLFRGCGDEEPAEARHQEVTTRWTKHCRKNDKRKGLTNCVKRTSKTICLPKNSARKPPPSIASMMQQMTFPCNPQSGQWSSPWALQACKPMFFFPPRGPQEVPPFPHFLSLCPPHTRLVGWCESRGVVERAFWRRAPCVLPGALQTSLVRQEGGGGGFGVGDPDHF